MSGRERLDGATLSLMGGLFTAAAEEMGATLMRTAHSPNIKERLDHSCALFDGRARLVAQAAHIPVHLGSLPRAVEAALAAGPMAAGDVVMLNDPWAGGTHLPDITLVSPVFLPGRPRADFLVASRAHHADVGGSAPGSMPLAREVYEEGFRIPPVWLARRGVRVDDVWRLLLANVRTPDERRADLEAQLGAQATGAARLVELARRRGGALVRRAAAAWMDASAAAVRRALAGLPRGTWRFEDALDDDGRGHGPLPIAVRLTLDGRRVAVDFTGSSPQVDGPVNAVEPVTRAAVAYVVRVVLGGGFAVNDGAFRALAITAPEGSIVNARPPAAVNAGNVETSQRIVDAVFGAFARALPGRIPAASAGTMNNLLIGGRDPSSRPFAYYETLGGGHGAGPDWDGASAMQVHMTNTRNTPVEALEHAYPLRVRSMRVRRGSGGRGLRRGGDGIERAIEMGVPVRVTVMSERRARGPWGLAGGGDGRPGENRVQSDRTRARTRRLPGKFQIDLAAGAVLTVASPGGGGYGRASQRRAARRTRS